MMRTSINSGTTIIRKVTGLGIISKNDMTRNWEIWCEENKERQKTKMAHILDWVNYKKQSGYK